MTKGKARLNGKPIPKVLYRFAKTYDNKKLVDSLIKALKCTQTIGEFAAFKGDGLIRETALNLYDQILNIVKEVNEAEALRIKYQKECEELARRADEAIGLTGVDPYGECAMAYEDYEKRAFFSDEIYIPEE